MSQFYVRSSSGGGGGDAINTITGNTGGAVGPDVNNNINVIGNTGVTVAGNAGTNTLLITVSGASPLEFDTDSGTATESANTITFIGGTSTADNANGITFTGASATVTGSLTNRLSGTVTTSNATPTTLISFPLPAVGTYTFDLNIAAYNTTDTLGASYSVFLGAKRLGGTASKLNLEDKVVNEEVGMEACDVSVTTASNNVILQATGIAAKTINWNAVGTYVYIGA